MKYTYSVIRYVHDSSAGESLNCGVMVHAPETHFFALQWDRSPSRFEAAFRGFDADLYRKVMTQLEDAVATASENPRLVSVRDTGEFMRRVWPDNALNFRGSEARPGEVEDPVSALTMLYSQLVSQQAPANSTDGPEELAPVLRSK